MRHLASCFPVVVLVAWLPVSAHAAVRAGHGRHHHRHAARRAAVVTAQQGGPEDVRGAGVPLRAKRVRETPAHRRRRLGPVTPPQTADAQVFIPPARIRHIPPPMRGTYASLVRQNEMADAAHLDRVEDDGDLLRMRRLRLLVPLPVTAVLRVNPDLPADRRFTRPWTARFLTELSRAHAQRYHSYLQVNSAVRTVDFQRALLRVNANAAPAHGDVASPHLTGQAVDIAKRDLSTQEIAWMRLYLQPLERAHKIDVEEEFQQACFHISVYPAYAARPGTKLRRRGTPVQEEHAGPSAALLAARLP